MYKLILRFGTFDHFGVYCFALSPPAVSFAPLEAVAVIFLSIAKGDRPGDQNPAVIVDMAVLRLKLAERLAGILIQFHDDLSHDSSDIGVIATEYCTN